MNSLNNTLVADMGDIFRNSTVVNPSTKSLSFYFLHKYMWVEFAYNSS